MPTTDVAFLRIIRLTRPLLAAVADTKLRPRRNTLPRSLHCGGVFMSSHPFQSRVVGRSELLRTVCHTENVEERYPPLGTS